MSVAPRNQLSQARQSWWNATTITASANPITSATWIRLL